MWKHEVNSEVCESRAKTSSSERTLDHDDFAGGLVIGIDVESSGSESDDSWTPSKGYRWVWNSPAPSHSASSSETCEPLPSWVQAAYEEGSTVEYFSCHNDQWLLAVVSLAALHMEPLGRDSFVAVVYNVRIGRTQQQRTDVDLRYLRRPLEPHESVEVRTLPSGAWQTARISKAAQSDLGRAYIVALDGAGGTSLVVPATSVRRRFPHGSTVFAYRGTTDGWVSGVLENVSSSDLSGCPNMAGSLMPVQRVTRNCDSKRRLAAPVAPTDNSNVDQRDFAVSFAGRVERVPAHLMDPSADKQ